MSATDPEVGAAEGNGYRHAGGGDRFGSADGDGSMPSGGAWRLRGPDDYVRMAGGQAPENFPSPVESAPDNGLPGHRGVPGLPGRFLLRLISVVPERCPIEERTKFYLMSATVLLNAGAAAYTVPTGISIAYPGLNGLAKAGLALLGAGIVGVIDALIVGYWLSSAKYQLNPPLDMPPPMPSMAKRLGVFIPRLAFTCIIVFGLGLLLTISANAGDIKKQVALESINDHTAAVNAAEAHDKQVIARDTPELKAAQARLNGALALQNADANRASCEAYGTPRVAGCSPFPAMGPIYREFYNKANGSDKAAVASAQAQVDSLQNEIAQARADLKNQDNSKNVASAAAPPTGLSAISAAWNQYTAIHHVDWINRHLMELLVLAIDIVPLGMKLFAGTSTYEAVAWERGWNDAIHTKRRRQSEHSRLSVLTQFYQEAAGKWRDSRLLTVGDWLDAESGEIPEPPGVADDTREGGADDQAEQEPRWGFRSPGGGGWQTDPPGWREEPRGQPGGTSGPQADPPGRQEGSDPIREGRDPMAGDIVSMPSGQYKLLTKITNTESYNGDVFIAGRVRYSQHVEPEWNIPIKALKFTRLNSEPSRSEIEFVKRLPPAGETLLPLTVRPTGRYKRLIYESPYFPRSDVMRYLYGRPRTRDPRVTVEQVINIMLSVNDAHQRIWEWGFLHNDTRLRNLIMTGPAEDGGPNPGKLMPVVGRDRQPGDVLLSDWGALSDVHDGEAFPNSVLECDPAVVRAFREHTEHESNPFGFASDRYGLFACAYQLITGGISPTEGLLIYRYNNDPAAVAHLEDRDVIYGGPAGARVEGWPDVLTEDPLPVDELNPGIPPSLAELIDAGVRADPLRRVPAGGGAARDMAEELKALIRQVAGGLTRAALDQELPVRSDDYLWPLDPPVGWPDDVLDFVEEHWPEYVE